VNECIWHINILLLKVLIFFSQVLEAVGPIIFLSTDTKKLRNEGFLSPYHPRYPDILTNSAHPLVMLILFLTHITIDFMNKKILNYFFTQCCREHKILQMKLHIENGCYLGILFALMSCVVSLALISLWYDSCLYNLNHLSI
jgi:hypothetical protein